MPDCNEFLRMLNMSQADRHALEDGVLDLAEEERRYPKRRTPDGEPTVKDIVKPGDMVITNYGTGPYRVEHVDEFQSYIGDPWFTLVLSKPDERYNKDGSPHPANHYWINGLVAVGGLILGYFVEDTDTVTVTDRTKAEGTQLGLI